jgi:hypothetical protein
MAPRVFAIALTSGSGQLLAGVAGGVAEGAAPEEEPVEPEPIEPVLPVEGLVEGEEDEPGVVAVSVLLPQAPKASAEAKANAVTATVPNFLSYMSIPF